MTKATHFEQSLAELESIVAELEKGELSLDDSLKQFEKGIATARQCQSLLRKAEKKIEVLGSTHANDE